MYNKYMIHKYMYLLHDSRDIEYKYGFLECEYTAILHGSTTDCTAASARGYRRLLTVQRGRINGGNLILSLIHLCNCHVIIINNNVLQLVV